MLNVITSEKLSKFNKQENKLPSKEERKKMKEEQENIEAMAKAIKAKLEKFVIDEILPSDIPVNFIEEIPELLKNLIKIYYTDSKEWADFLAARKKIYETPFNQLTSKDE